MRGRGTKKSKGRGMKMSKGRSIRRRNGRKRYMINKLRKKKNIKGKDRGDDDSNGSPTTPTSFPSTSGVKRFHCKNKNYHQCYGQEHVCLSTHASTCEVHYVTIKPVCSCDYRGVVCQDPRFIGGDGLTFYFHGKKNKDF